MRGRDCGVRGGTGSPVRPDTGRVPDGYRTGKPPAAAAAAAIRTKFKLAVPNQRVKGLCHRCNTSNVGVEIKDGIPVCRGCLEKQAAG